MSGICGVVGDGVEERQGGKEEAATRRRLDLDSNTVLLQNDRRHSFPPRRTVCMEVFVEGLLTSVPNLVIAWRFP